MVEALLGAVLGDAPPELRLSDIISVAGAVGALLEAATRNPNVAPRAGNAWACVDAMVLGDLVLGLDRGPRRPGPTNGSSKPPRRC